MKKFRLFITIFFLLTSLIIIAFIAIIDKNFILLMLDEIRNYIWPAGIATAVFIILLSAGIVSNASSIEGKLFGNGFFQLAILELFIVAAGLAWYRTYNQQPGQIVFKLESETKRAYVYMGVRYQSGDGTSMDTVRAPGKLVKKPSGRYTVETLDQDIVHFKTDIHLNPAESETVLVPVNLNVNTLSINSEPPGADIWINGIQATQTPYTFDILTGDTVIFDLKLEGYQTYTDTLSLTEDLDLGIISLRKLFTLWISSKYMDIRYHIIDRNGKTVFSSYSSRKIQLPQDDYRLRFEIGEGQYETKRISLNYNQTVMIP